MNFYKFYKVFDKLHAFSFILLAFSSPLASVANWNCTGLVFENFFLAGSTMSVKSGRGLAVNCLAFVRHRDISDEPSNFHNIHNFVITVRLHNSFTCSSSSKIFWSRSSFFACISLVRSSNENGSTSTEYECRSGRNGRAKSGTGRARGIGSTSSRTWNCENRLPAIGKTCLR